MAILDRFRSLPANKHADPDVRLAHVEALSLEEREQLVSIAREDESARVRRAAVGKLMDPVVLAAVAREDQDAAVRTHAVSMLRDIALEAFEETGESEALAAVDAVVDPKTLSHIAKTAKRESVARRALAGVADARTFGSIARHAVLESVRQAAFEAVDEHSEIVAIAMNSEFKDTALAAVEQLTDRAELAQVASGSANKTAAKRARGILREMDQRAAAQAAEDAAREPDAAVTSLTAERWQVVQHLELLAPDDDLESVETALMDAEARWAQLAAVPPAPDLAIQSRFSAAAAKLTAWITSARSLDLEREREAAEAARLEKERQAASRALGEAAARAAHKDAERRRIRLAELVQEIEAAAGESDLRAARRRLTLAVREWTDLVAATPADDELAARHADAVARLAARESEAKEADARQRSEALSRLQRLLARVEPLATQKDLSAKAADRALRDVRAALVSLPSKQDFEELTRRLKTIQAALVPRLQELRALEDWQRWANVGIQEALCEKMEALKSSEDAEEIVHRVRDLQQQWRQAADVPRAQGDALWRRFKAAHDEVWSRCEAFFAAEAQKRAENLARKVALCEQVEALADSTKWIQTAEEIKRLQTEWKTIGPVSRGQEKAIWDRFRSACDRFFTRRHEDLAKLKIMWAENLRRKEELCVKAETLAESVQWEVAAAEIKRLQAEWKTVGPVKKNRSDAVWQRFRSACDRFFARYAQRHEIALTERVAAREAICAELERLAQPPASPESGSDTTASPSDVSSDEPPPDLMGIVRGLRSRWQHELAQRGVDPERAAALDQRFAAAHQQVVARWPRVFRRTDLDPEANRERMEELVRRVEHLAASFVAPQGSGLDESLSPTTRLATMLKEALAANTIGGRVDDDSRWRAAQEEARQAQASWARIGPVPEPARRTLTDRFQRACKKILDKQGGTGGPGRLAGSGRSGEPARSGSSTRSTGS
jgi:hypothetical protein